MDGRYKKSWKLINGILVHRFGRIDEKVAPPDTDLTALVKTTARAIGKDRRRMMMFCSELIRVFEDVEQRKGK